MGLGQMLISGEIVYQNFKSLLSHIFSHDLIFYGMWVHLHSYISCLVIIMMNIWMWVHLYSYTSCLVIVMTWCILECDFIWIHIHNLNMYMVICDVCLFISLPLCLLYCMLCYNCSWYQEVVMEWEQPLND